MGAFAARVGQGYRARSGECQGRIEGVSLVGITGVASVQQLAWGWSHPATSHERGGWGGEASQGELRGRARALFCPLVNHPHWRGFCRQTPGLAGRGVTTPPPSPIHLLSHPIPSPSEAVPVH